MYLSKFGNKLNIDIFSNLLKNSMVKNNINPEHGRCMLLKCGVLRFSGLLPFSAVVGSVANDAAQHQESTYVSRQDATGR
jgi:hypothetical protein